PVFRIGDGPAERLPVSVLPEPGAAYLSGLEQKQPADLISAWVRLWISGFLKNHADWDGVICATHGDVTHWVHVSAGEAISSQSALTLRLSRSLGGSSTTSQDAINDTIARPERLAAYLRVAEVAGDASAIVGHLVGAELAATRPYWLGQQVAVISDHAALYEGALQTQGVPTISFEPDDLIEPGLAVVGRVLGFSD
ncbi:MAG: 2-dehydro-3-deoxygalactonokinase, partial [Pseudomonadota bacterium]